MAKLTKAQMKKKAIAAVVKAAIAWVDFEDDGLVGSLPIQVKINDRLVKSVHRYKMMEIKL